MKLKHLLAVAVMIVIGGGNSWAQSVGDVLTVGGTKYKIKTANIITNGNFDDGTNGWTNASNFSSALPSDKFSVAQDGTNNYLKGTKNEGSTANGSLGTAWSIESGKTYYFSFRIKALGSETNTQYIKTALTNAKGTETSVLGTPTAVKDDWKAFEKIFTNDQNYKYLQCQFRWLNNQWGFDNFMLYEVEQYDPYTDKVNISYAANLDFNTGAVDKMICTYWKDMGANSTTNSRMQNVNGWIHEIANSDASAAGVFAYNGSAKLGSSDNNGAMPSAAPDAQSNGNGLGMVAVWSGKVQYSQYVTMPAGVYDITIPVYNVAGTTAFSKNLIGFVEKNGTEHLLTTTKYNVGEWTTEHLRIELEEETDGYLTIGYNGANAGSAASQHLFVDRLSINAKTKGEALLESIADALGNENANVPVGKMNAIVASTLAEKVQAAENATTSNTNEELTTILSELNDAINEAKASVAVYSHVNKYISKGNALDEAGKASFANVAESEISAYNDGTITDASTELPALITALATATRAQTSVDADWTGVLVDPSFEEGSDVWRNGWTTDRGTTGNFDYKRYEETLNTNGTAEGKYVLNAWAPQIEHIYVTQNVNLPVGVYQLSAAVYSDRIKDQHVEAIANGKNYKSAIVSNNKWETLSTQFIVSEEGDVTIGIYANGNNANGNTNGWFRVDNFKLTYVCAPATAPMSITSVGTGTFVAPFDVTLPSGVTAYTATVNGEYAKMTEVEGTTLPAGTPVIVKSETEVNETFYGKSTIAETICTSDGNDLVGSLAAQTVPSDGTYYALQNNDPEGLGFYKINSDSYQIKANRAYLKTTTPAGASLRMVFGDETGIKAVESTENGAMYNISGLRVNDSYKGIVIKNGKKYLNK